MSAVAEQMAKIQMTECFRELGRLSHNMIDQLCVNKIIIGDVYSFVYEL